MSWDEKDWAYTWITGKRYCFTLIKGETYRLDLLFRKRSSKSEMNLSEAEAILYANHSYVEKKESELLKVRQIAEIYGIYIQLGYHIYDFRHERCQLENINMDSLSPLNIVNIGIFVSSLSTFDFTVSQ